MRLDQYLVLERFFESRNKAAEAIRNGFFSVNGRIVSKPAYEMGDADQVVLLRQERQYVSRSAYKLLHGIRMFRPNWNGWTAADFGASTGGFCQVLLEQGIRRIYAVDIGQGQLHPSVCAHPAIRNMENMNARYLTAADFPEPIQLVTADLSFISIQLVLPAIARSLSTDGEAVVLVKPQFEAGSAALSKTGVVHNRKVHEAVLLEVVQTAGSLGFGVKGISFSGLSGERGNREYLLYLSKEQETSIVVPEAVKQAVYREEAP